MKWNQRSVLKNAQLIERSVLKNVQLIDQNDQQYKANDNPDHDSHLGSMISSFVLQNY